VQKYALCIGINNYPGTENDLSGCVNDANDWAAELKRRGFEVTLLLDAQSKKAAMVESMRGLITKAKAGDNVVITYSGHGTWLPDQDGDEADGRDEALCPYDLMTESLTDDELFEIFTDRNPRTRLIFISDSCHSGTVARYHLATGATRRIRFMPPAFFIKDPSVLARARSVERVPVRGRARSSALLFAGCQDTEYSWDANFAGRPNGAFTRTALDVLKQLPESATYLDWHQAIAAKLPTAEYPQKPNLVATRAQRRWKIFS
jgi:metacaspase-1